MLVSELFTPIFFWVQCDPLYGDDAILNIGFNPLLVTIHYLIFLSP